MPTIYIIGDSTVEDNTPPFRGWGWALPGYVAPGVQVANHAMSGRSSLSFMNEGRFAPVEEGMQPGDLLLIQFGHNDEKPDAERATTPEDTYPAYLSQYIDAALQAGAEPVLLTPIARRRFDGQGRLVSTHGAYPDAMRALAARRGVRLLDMERSTESLRRDLGEEGSKALFNWQAPGHPNYPEGVQDDTHLCLMGATQLARLALTLMEESGAERG